MTPFDLVIFDCDGVLVDSEPLSNRILCEAICTLGIPMGVAETRARFVGLSMTKVVSALEAELEISLPESWLGDLQLQTFEVFRQELQPVRNVRTAIESVHEAGLQTCVASSGAPEKIAFTLGLTKLAAYFEERIYSAEMVSHGKPAPDLFLHAAAQMEVPPERCVVIEDSLPGVQAALAAGMEVRAYIGDVDGPHEKIQALNVQTFGDMMELPNRLGL